MRRLAIPGFYRTLTLAALLVASLLAFTGLATGAHAQEPEPAEGNARPAAPAESPHPDATPATPPAEEPPPPSEETAPAAAEQPAPIPGRLLYSLDSRAVSRTFSLSGPGAPNAYDYYNSCPMYNAGAFTWRATLHGWAYLSATSSAGIALTGYGKSGSDAVAAFYGVQPPVNGTRDGSVVFRQRITANGNDRFDSNRDDAFVFDCAWFRDEKSEFACTVGNFTPSGFSSLVYYGEDSPFLAGEPVLPLRGAIASGVSGDFSWEGMGAVKAAGTGFDIRTLALRTRRPIIAQTNYPIVFIGGNVKWTVLRDEGRLTDLSLQYLHIADDTSETIARVPPRPRRQSVLGGRLTTGALVRGFTFEGEYYRSGYTREDISDVSARALRLALSRKMGDDEIALEYFSIDPEYDPFIFTTIAGVKRSSHIPIVGMRPNESQIHDYGTYPNNTESLTLSWTHPVKYGSVVVKLNSSGQVRPNTLASTSEYFIDQAFPELARGDTAKGATRTASIEADLSKGERSTFYGYLSVSKSLRDSRRVTQVPLVISSYVNEDSMTAYLSYTHRLGSQWSLGADLNYMQASGASGTESFDYKQLQPALGVTWQPAKDSSLTVKYRAVNHRDGTSGSGDFLGSDLTFDAIVKF